MNRTWTIVEKVFAVVQITIGMILIAFLCFFDLPNHHYTLSQLLSLIYHKYLIMCVLIILFLSGGTLLLMNKKAGWISSMAIWLYSIALLILEFSKDKKRFHPEHIFTWIAFILVTFGFVVFLNRSDMLKKYTISKTDWLASLIIASLMMVYIYINHLF